MKGKKEGGILSIPLPVRSKFVWRRMPAQIGRYYIYHTFPYSMSMCTYIALVFMGVCAKRRSGPKHMGIVCYRERIPRVSSLSTQAMFGTKKRATSWMRSAASAGGGPRRGQGSPLPFINDDFSVDCTRAASHVTVPLSVHAMWKIFALFLCLVGGEASVRHHHPRCKDTVTLVNDEDTLARTDDLVSLPRVRGGGGDAKKKTSMASQQLSTFEVALAGSMARVRFVIS